MIQNILANTRDNGHAAPPASSAPSVESILAGLLASGLHVQWSETTLHVSPRSKITEEQRGAITRHKPELLAYLLAHGKPNYRPAEVPEIPASTREELQKQLNKCLNLLGEAEELTWDLERTSYQRCRQRVHLEQAGHLLGVAYSLLLSVEDDGIKPQCERKAG